MRELSIGRKWIWIPAFFLMGLLMASLPAGAGDQPKSNTGWTDTFEKPSLDTRWTWVREDPTHWSLKERPGFLRITTQTGGVFGPERHQKNLLLTPAPEGDFRITTRCTINPTQNYQYAGLFVYQGDDRYVQLNRAYTDGGGSFNFDIEKQGNPKNIRVPASATTFYLRITKHGDTYTGEYSLDGESWTKVGEGTVALENPKIGIGAANNLAGVPEIPADFDLFKLESPL